MVEALKQAAKKQATSNAAKGAAATNPVTSPVNGQMGTAPAKNRFAANDPKNPKTADPLLSAPNEHSPTLNVLEKISVLAMPIFAWDLGSKAVGWASGIFGDRSKASNPLGTRIKNKITTINETLQRTNAENLEAVGADIPHWSNSATPPTEINRATIAGKTSVAGLINSRLAKVTTNIAKQSPELEKISNAVWEMSRLLKNEGPAGAHIANNLNTHLLEAKNHIANAGNLSSSAEAYETALKGITEQNNAAKTLLKGGVEGKRALSQSFTHAHNTISTAIEGESKSRMLRGAKRTGGMLQNATKATKGYNNLRAATSPLNTLKSSLKSIPAIIAKKPTHSTLFDATFIAEAGVSNITLAKDVSFHMTNLCHLCEMMTGEKKVSNFHVLFSNDVPTMVKHARKQIFASFGPRTILEVASDGLTAAGFLKNNFFMMMAPMALRMAAGVAAPKYDFLTDYGQLSEAQKQGETLEGAHYAKLIAGASAAVEASGGDMNGLTVDVAKHYAENQTPIDQVLRDIESGKMNEIALGLQKERAAAGIAVGSMDPEAKARAEAEEVHYNEVVSREPNHLGKEAPKPQIATAEAVHASPTQNTMQQPTTAAATIPTAMMPESTHVESNLQQGIQ